MPDPPSWASSTGGGDVVTAIRGQIIHSNATSSGSPSPSKTPLWDYVTGTSGRGLAGSTFSRPTDEEKEILRNQLAEELLRWYNSITPEKIDVDIQHVFEQHETMGEHMKAPHPAAWPEDMMWSCNHESEFVRLDNYREASDTQQGMFFEHVRPASNYSI
jgi:hypothetical protein